MATPLFDLRPDRSETWRKAGPDYTLDLEITVNAGGQVVLTYEVVKMLLQQHGLVMINQTPL